MPDLRAKLFALARRLLPEGASADALVVTIEAQGVKIVLEDRPATPAPAPVADDGLTAIERSIAIFLRDPNQSIRAIAKKAGCSHSVLSESEQFRRLRAVFTGNLPRGSKSKDGGIDADDE